MFEFPWMKRRRLEEEAIAEAYAAAFRERVRSDAEHIDAQFGIGPLAWLYRPIPILEKK